MIGSNRGSWPAFAPAFALSLVLALIAGLAPGYVRAQSPLNPTVTLNPASGPPGTEVTATGKGWASGSVVVLWDGSQSRGTVSVSTGGDWQTTFSVPADAASGSHDIAFRQNPPGAAITIVKTFSVSAGSPIPNVAAPPATGTGGYLNGDGVWPSNRLSLLSVGLVIAGLLLVVGSLIVRRAGR